jgi:hypothetical protein
MVRLLFMVILLELALWNVVLSLFFVPLFSYLTWALSALAALWYSSLGCGILFGAPSCSHFCEGYLIAGSDFWL